MARDYFQPNNPDSRRVLELCGGDPAALIAELDARPAPEPQLTERVKKVLELAGDDAARRRETQIAPGNILVGMFRVPHVLPMHIVGTAGIDGERFRGALEGRLLAEDDVIPHEPLLLDATSQGFIARAVARVHERKVEHVMPHDLLFAMLEPDDGEAATFFASCGGDVSTLRRMLSSF
jgi:ATP-dependent Clp protease ATP-binding subunit ClpA